MSREGFLGLGSNVGDRRANLQAAVDWVLADYRSRFSSGGVWEEDGELWAPDGTLLAQSRQLALIRA